MLKGKAQKEVVVKNGNLQFRKTKSLRIYCRGFFLLVLLFTFIPWSLQAQKSEDVLDYIEEKLWTSPEESLQLGESFLRRAELTDDKKCKVYYLMAKAHGLLEDYDRSLDYIFRIVNQNCTLEPSASLGLLMLEEEVYAALNLEDYRKTTVQKINAFLKEMESEVGVEQLKTEWKVYADFRRLSQALFLGPSTVGELEYPENKVFLEDKLLLGKYVFLRFHAKDRLADGLGIEVYRKKYPEWSRADVEKFYYRFFSLYEALWEMKEGNADRGIQLLKDTAENLEEEEKRPYYQRNLYEALKKYESTQLNRNETGRYRNLEHTFSNQVDLISTNAITKVFSNRSEFHFKDQQKALDSHKKIRDLLLFIGLAISLVLLVFLLRYRWQEKYYKEISDYILKMNESKNKAKEKLTEAVPVSSPTGKSRISFEMESQILEGLQLFESEGKYLEQDISLALVASELKVNTKYLSEVLNSRLNENFNAYINRLRIEYIVSKLKSNPEYLKYKISYLAEVSGYSSHSSFSTAFKSITGMPPTKFIGYLKREV